LAGFSHSLYVPDELGSVSPGLGLAPLPTRSGRAALLLGHGVINEQFEPSLPPALRVHFRLRTASSSSRRRSLHFRR